jgi:hypothetical protein
MMTSRVARAVDNAADALKHNTAYSDQAARQRLLIRWTQASLEIERSTARYPEHDDLPSIPSSSETELRDMRGDSDESLQELENNLQGWALLAPCERSLLRLLVRVT